MRISINQLCKEDGSRVKYKKVCSSCGKEIGAGDIVKGFEYEKGKYVTLSDDDFEKAKSEKDKTIHILHFTDLKNIRPIYYDKTYGRGVPRRRSKPFWKNGPLTQAFTFLWIPWIT